MIAAINGFCWRCYGDRCLVVFVLLAGGSFSNLVAFFDRWRDETDMWLTENCFSVSDGSPACYFKRPRSLHRVDLSRWTCYVSSGNHMCKMRTRFGTKTAVCDQPGSRRGCKAFVIVLHALRNHQDSLEQGL